MPPRRVGKVAISIMMLHERASALMEAEWIVLVVDNC